MAKSSKLPIALLVAAVIALALCGGAVVIFSGDDDKKPAAQPSPSASASPSGPARDSGLEFTVGEVRCGVDKVGTDPAVKTAQGEFCLVTLTVANPTAQPHLFLDAIQRAVLADGTQVRSDAVAGTFANGANQALIKEIAAGAQATGVVVFDIPKGTKITKLELHGSDAGTGVTVPIG